MFLDHISVSISSLILPFQIKLLKYHLEDQGIDGRMELECILGGEAGGVEWIHLAQNRDQWWALVNAVMNLQVLVPQS
jgi:hypothetical protein